MFPLVFTACLAGTPSAPSLPAAPVVDRNAPAELPVPLSSQAVAVFAGGCFWCMESDFDKLPGVVATTSGYVGGHTTNPTYEDVTSETTGHAEAVRVVYDTATLTYQQVLDWYWRHTDPTDGGGQFCDRGDSYRPAIFYADDDQKHAAEASKAALDATRALPGPIATQIAPVGTFYGAENYHQDFHHTNPGRYLPYRMGCRRDAKVAAMWAAVPK